MKSTTLATATERGEVAAGCAAGLEIHTTAIVRPQHGMQQRHWRHNPTGAGTRK